MRDPMPERHPWYVLLDLAGAGDDQALRGELQSILAEEAERGRLDDAVIAQSLEQAQDLWRLREGIPEATRLAEPALRSDIAVAVRDVPKFVARATAAVHAAMPGVRVMCFGHVGDGNLHFNVLPPSAPRVSRDWSKPLKIVLYDVVDALNGSFSAEHGVGQAKRNELRRYKSDVEIAMMQAVKHTFDPRNLMNPGKVL
jgi:FAD/FMN-containing dehydrogenase